MKRFNRGNLCYNNHFKCCRLGSARAVNRRYISDCVPLRIRMQASAGFVSASALGMACGPALAGLLQIKFKFYKLTFNQSTLPGWVMAVAWLFYLVWLCISFKEPLRDTEEQERSKRNETSSSNNLTILEVKLFLLLIVNELFDWILLNEYAVTERVEEGIRKPLLITSGILPDDEEDCDESEESADDSRRPANSFGDAYRLLTPSVKVSIYQSQTCSYIIRIIELTCGFGGGQVQLLIYFMLKYAMEILLSESSVVTSYYFGWTTSSVAIFLACLGLTVLPINILVGSYISNMFEDR